MRAFLCGCACLLACFPALARAEAAHEYYWEKGEARPFAAVSAGLGIVSALDIALGYGKPHWMWVGGEDSVLLTPEFASVSLGPRLAFLIGDISLKRRRTLAFSHGFLPRQKSYDADDIAADAETTANYASWDGSLWGLLPLGPVLGQYEVAFTRVEGVPAGYDLFEEYQRVTVRGNWIYAARFGLCRALLEDKLLLGALGEWLSAEGRGVTWRLGPTVHVELTDHLSGAFVYTIPVSSPDSLGAVLGAWGVLRLSYAFATGEPHPAFP